MKFTENVQYNRAVYTLIFIKISLAFGSYLLSLSLFRYGFATDNNYHALVYAADTDIRFVFFFFFFDSPAHARRRRHTSIRNDKKSDRY